MPVNTNLKWIFIHIPKTGGSSIARYMYEQSGTPLELWGRIKSRDRERFGLQDAREVDCPDRYQHLYHHLRAAEVRKVVGDEVWTVYTKFTVIRNPWDRLVSFYEYARQTGERGGTAGRSFEEWVEYRSLFPKMSPYIMSEEGDILVDYVIRFENLMEDFKQMHERLGSKYTPSQIPHEKKTVRDDYRCYYTSALAQKVYDELKEEIDFFGYKF